jgi:hypothetical protein
LFQERELAAWQNRSLPVPSGPMRRCAGYGSGGRTEAAAWDAGRDVGPRIGHRTARKARLGVSFVIRGTGAPPGHEVSIR